MTKTDNQIQGYSGTNNVKWNIKTLKMSLTQCLSAIEN